MAANKSKITASERKACAGGAWRLSFPGRSACSNFDIHTPRREGINPPHEIVGRNLTLRLFISMKIFRLALRLRSTPKVEALPGLRALRIGCGELLDVPFYLPEVIAQVSHHQVVQHERHGFRGKARIPARRFDIQIFIL